LIRMDPLDDLPPRSRVEVVAAIAAASEVDAAAAEEILRASEPFWNVLERSDLSSESLQVALGP